MDFLKIANDLMKNPMSVHEAMNAMVKNGLTWAEAAEVAFIFNQKNKFSPADKIDLWHTLQRSRKLSVQIGLRQTAMKAMEK